MSEGFAVTVVLSTHDRCHLLGPAIRRLQQQSPGTPPYEVIIVDNNSGDATRGVVEECAASGGVPVRYVYEPRLGLSYGRNAGIAAAQTDIVAFTDDDVRVTADWVRVIHRTFAAHPEVDCLGGRTLPLWPSVPPAWLTPLHWVGPLALQDYGNEPFLVDARRALCLAGANLAFRKGVFDRVGLFSPEFPRSEDTELMLRFWLSGGRALYVPEMTAQAAVQPERLCKAYHRKWHFNIGRCNARMALEELTAADGGLRPLVPKFPRVMGVPLFSLRRLAGEALRWAVETVRGRESLAFWHETQVRALAGYIRESAALYRRRGGRLQAAAPVAAEAAHSGSSSLSTTRLR